MNLKPYYENDIEYVDHVVMQHEPEVREAVLHLLGDGEVHSVIEIGTWEGGTAYLWGQMVDRYKDGAVYCVDLHFGSKGEHIFGHGIENGVDPIYRDKPCGKKIFELQGRSDDPKLIEALSALLDGRKVDFFFHDGSHTYEDAKADFENYSRFVRPGGWMAFCDWADETHGVSRLWPELKAKYEAYEFVIQKMPPEKQKSHRWLGFKNGIGLIRWPGEFR